jgi:hypothetical protein
MTATQRNARATPASMRIATSVCLAYPVVDALAAGYEVSFVEDAVGAMTRRPHA